MRFDENSSRTLLHSIVGDGSFSGRAEGVAVAFLDTDVVRADDAVLAAVEKNTLDKVALI